MFRLVSILVPVVALAGCVGAQPARPTVISTQTSAPDAMDRALRVLAQHGFTAERVDDRAGVIQTRWQETTFMYGQNEYKQTRYIARRLTVTVAPQATGSEVVVRAEDTACVNPGALAEGLNADADCIAVPGLVPPDQELLDRVGADLHGALGSAPSTAVR